MKTNEHAIDRVVRVAIGIITLAAAFVFLGAAGGSILGVAVGIVGVVALLTGVVGFCPAYKLVGLSTCPLNKA